jgi:hypothetical protein
MSWEGLKIKVKYFFKIVTIEPGTGYTPVISANQEAESRESQFTVSPV